MKLQFLALGIIIMFVVSITLPYAEAKSMPSKTSVSSGKAMQVAQKVANVRAQIQSKIQAIKANMPPGKLSKITLKKPKVVSRSKSAIIKNIGIRK